MRSKPRHRTGRTGLLWPSLPVLLLLSACQPAADDAESRSEARDVSRPAQAAMPSDAPASVGDSTRAAPLPGLVGVMRGLERDMARLSRGLWIADHDTIAAAARAVATHPKVPPSEAQWIASILGPDMADFKGFDTEVHDLALRVTELAREEDMVGIVAAEAGLRAGCVACHTRFRDRILEAPR